MNWRSSRFFPFLVILLLLVIGIGITAVYILARTSPNITIVWQVSTTQFTQQDQQDIQTAWKTLLVTPNPSPIAGHEFTIIDAQRQGEWAIFSANERVTHDAQPIATEPLFFIAHRQGTTWTVSISSSS